MGKWRIGFDSRMLGDRASIRGGIARKAEKSMSDDSDTIKDEQRCTF